MLPQQEIKTGTSFGVSIPNGVKRLALLILVAFVIGCGVHFSYYYLATRQTKSLVSAQGGEMEWVRHEFRLSDEQFARVKALHEAYDPRCIILCKKIADANSLLDRQVRTSSQMTPEIKAAMVKCASVQLECRQAMLEHIYEVSNCMSPESAVRYRNVMISRIVQPALRSEGAVTGMQ